MSAADGDFSGLLKNSGYVLSSGTPVKGSADVINVQATTVMALHYAGGVLIAGDRRATAGNTVVYDRADKVIELDERTVMAIAGAPATAFEMARVLQHSFQYYRRSQLQPLSREAKIRALGRLLKENLPMTLQGVGVVIPILAIGGEGTDDLPQIYFYDALGAQFQAAAFTASGSGSPAVRSVLDYVNRWSGRPTIQRNRDEAIRLALQLLDVAAEGDTATGGIDRRSRIFPQVKLLTTAGLESLPQADLEQVNLEAA